MRPLLAIAVFFAIARHEPAPTRTRPALPPGEMRGHAGQAGVAGDRRIQQRRDSVSRRVFIFVGFRERNHPEPHPLSRQVQTLGCLLWARDVDQWIRLCTWAQGAPAAASSVDVFEIDGGLPASPASLLPAHRLIGHYWEDEMPLVRCFGSDGRSPEAFDRAVGDLCDYLEFSGQNVGRTLDADRKQYVYLVNRSPATARVALSPAIAPGNVQPLGSSPVLTSTGEGCEVILEPYQLAAWVGEQGE